MINRSSLASKVEQGQYFYLILPLLFIKFFLATIIPLVGDETYYWVWGKNLQLSYFDHPAMVAVLTHLSQVFGATTSSFGLRWPFVIVSTFTFYVFLKTVRIHNFTNIIFVSLLFNLNPFLGVGSILATPDVPFLFFWSLCFYFVMKILETQKTVFYLFLGISLGLGFCSKYHTALFPLIIIPALYFNKQLRSINIKKLIFLFKIFG